MKEHNTNDYVFGGEEPILNLDITTEIHFSRKDHPEGKLVPVSVDGKEEFVLIPLDVKDGSKLKFEGRGKYNPRLGQTGDLYVLVHIEENRVPWKKILMLSTLLAAVIATAFLVLKKPTSKPALPTEPVTTSCIHVWIPADCTTPKTCKICGEVSGNKLEHQWEEATYDVPKTCHICGITEGEVLKNPLAELRVGDSFTYGVYEQDNNYGNGSEPIEWLVLEKTDEKIFAITKYAIERIQFHTSETAITWEKCYLRQWLNSTFYGSAFSDDEQSQILTVSVTAENNPHYDNDPGNDTQDKLYILSTAEVAKYFSTKKDRVCYPTEYVDASGYLWKGSSGSVWWWLRTRGELNTDATTVNSDGSIDFKDGKVDATSGTVRPVMWIELT